MKQEKVTFKEALTALEKGRRITKELWGDPEMFVFKQVPSKINMTTVPLMQSIPDSVKREFERRLKGSDLVIYKQIRYEDQLCLVAPDNVIYSFVPTTSDILSEDWIVLDTDLAPQDIRREETKENKYSGDLSFGNALAALRNGDRIFRAGWEEKEIYLYYVPARSYASVTDTAKKEFGETTPYKEYIGMMSSKNPIAIWTPATSDVLANDWKIYPVSK